MRNLLTALVTMLVLLTAAAALAQPAPPPDPSTQGGAVALADWLIQAAHDHNYIGVLGAMLVGVVALVRWAAPKVHGRLGALINTDAGKSLLVLALGEVGSVGSALIAHKLDAHSLVSGAVVAFFAAGGYGTIKPIVSMLLGMVSGVAEKKAA